MGSAWHWFVAHQGVDAIVFAVVGGVVGWIGHQILRALWTLIDLLDTHTSGGLRDVVDALEGRRHGS